MHCHNGAAMALPGLLTRMLPSRAMPVGPWVRHGWLRLAGLTLTLMLMLGMLPTTALGQGEGAVASPLLPDGLPDLADDTVSVPFSVAGPLSPDDTELTLLAVRRSCGKDFDEAEAATAQGVATDDSAWFRVEVTTGPDGLPCDSERLVRVPVTLEAPLGERTIQDAADPNRLPPVNSFDTVETGLRYYCGLGTCSVADLLGPGLDVSRHGLTPPITNARAVYDSGDYVTWLGDYDPVKRRFACANAFLRNGEWRMHGQRCRPPRAAMYPGIDAATWRLRGKRPTPKDRFIRIWVQEEVCNGSPIRPRLQRPVVQADYSKGGAITIVMATTRQPTDPPRRTRTSGQRFGLVDCPGMAPVKAVVDLPLPIGKRPLLDGGVFPPQERWAERK